MQAKSRVFLGTILVAALASPAFAQDACLTDLEAVADAVAPLGGDPAQVDTAIETKLIEKVTSAVVKLSEGKPADAAQKIGDLVEAVEGLLASAKPKIDADNGDALLEAADAALTCLQPGG